MIFDDIGSFPLPEGIDREWVEMNFQSKEYREMVKRAFIMKAKVVELPNYPQFRDMNEMFLSIIRREENQEAPYLIKKSKAIIPEVEALKEMRINKLRVCITGPFELYIKEFGTKIYDDALEAFSTSVYRFAEKACEFDAVKCISLDEPSLGTNPELQPSKDQIEMAYEKFSKIGVDVQIHLHSPIFYIELLDIEGIDVIGIEYARDERAINLIEVEDLESYDKFLRVGVARSDFDSIMAEYMAKSGKDIWRDRAEMFRALEEMENIKTISKRIENALRRFDDRLKYIGADCGLMSFPTQEIAIKLLENIKKAKEGFE